jgi:hypothetical protein
MASSPLKDFASGILFGTTPGVTRPTVAAPSPFDDEEVDRRYEKFGITRYTDPSSYSSSGSDAYSQTDGTDPYRGPLSVSGMTQSVADQFVGMDKKLGAAISPLGFNPLISAGSFISKKNLENIEKNIAEGNVGYALGLLDGKIIGVSPGPFGGSVLSGVLPSGLSAEQRKELTRNLLSTREIAENPKDFAVSPTPTPESTDAEMASAGSANIVTDSSGRPVTQGGDPSSSGYGSYVTTGQGQYVDPSVIQDQGDAMTAAAEAAAPYANMTEDDFNPSDPGGSGGSTSQDFSAPSYDYDDFSGTPFAFGGEASKDPVQSTGFVDGPPQNYAKGTTVADTENHRVRVGSFVLNAPTTERLQKEGKLPKGPQKRKAAKGGKMMEVALSKGEYVIDVDDIGKFGGYDALNKENDKGKPEVERRQAAAQGGFLGGYSDGGMLRYAGPLSAIELMKSGLNVTTPTPSGFIQQKEYDSGGLPPYTVNNIDIGAVQKALTLVETRGYEDRNEGYFFTRSDKTGKESSAFGPLQITKKTLEAMKTDRFGELDLAFKTDPGLKKYYEKLITEGRNALNVKKYGDIYVGPEGSSKKTNASEKEKAKYRGLGYGNISLKEHKKYYPTLAGLYMRYKAGMSKSEEDLVRRHFGNDASMQKYYAAKEELGIN